MFSVVAKKSRTFFQCPTFS